MFTVQKKMLISRVDPFSFSPKEELRSLLICASYKAMQNLLESGLPRGSASCSNSSSAAALPAHQASL